MLPVGVLAEDSTTGINEPIVVDETDPFAESTGTDVPVLGDNDNTTTCNEGIDESVVVDGAASSTENAEPSLTEWPSGVPSVAFFSEKTPSTDTWLNENIAFTKGTTGETVTAWLVWDTTVHTTNLSKEFFSILLDNNTTGTTEIVNGTWDAKTDTNLAQHGIVLMPNFSAGYVEVSITYKDCYDLRMTLGGIEAWLNIDPETSHDTNLPALGFYSEHDRRFSVLLDEPVISGAATDDEVVYLLWDPDALKADSAQVVLNAVGNDAPVLNDTIINKDTITSTLNEHNITLTPDFTNGCIEIAVSAFSGNKNLTLILKDANGAELSSIVLSIDEETSSDSTGEGTHLPSVAFYDTNERSEDELIKNELMSGPVGKTRSAWLLWDPEVFSVTGKSDIQVCMDKNETTGLELSTREWTDDADIHLDNYKIWLSLEHDTSDTTKVIAVKVTATFVEDQTIDFALTLRDKNSEAHAVPLNIEYETSSSDKETGTENGDEDKEDEPNTVRGLRYRQLDRKSDLCSINPNQKLETNLINSLNRVSHLAFYYVEGEKETLLEFDDLVFPESIVSAKYIQNDPTLIDVTCESFGEGVITSKTYPGYSIPVSVVLPNAAFYSKNELAINNYLDETLPFTGDGSKVYILPSEDWVISDIVKQSNDMDFFACYIASGGSYAEITLSDGFGDKEYGVEVFLSRNNGNNTSSRTLWFEIEDRSPGLKWCEVDEDKGTFTVNDELNGRVNDTLNSWQRMIVYYMDGTTKLPVELDDLIIPDIVEAELLDKNNPYYFGLDMTKLGNGVITSKTYPGYSIPVSVELPEVAFYRTATRSGDTYLDDALPFTGEGSKVYILPDEEFTITGITLDPKNQGYDFGFFAYNIATNGKSVEVALSDDFKDDNYRIRIHMKHNDGWNTTNDLRFEVEDLSPGLKWSYVNKNNGQYVEDNRLNTEINGSLDDSERMAVYYVNGETKTRIPMEDLDFPRNTQANLVIDDNPYYFWLDFTSLGTGQITCGDYPNCVLPVSVELPKIGFYSSTERKANTYLRDILPFTGKDDISYILPAENWVITNIVLDPDKDGYDMRFFDCNIASNGSYAEISLSRGFEDERYSLRVYVEEKNGTGKDDFYLSFKINDTSPGLRYRYLTSESGYHFLEDNEPLQDSMTSYLYSNRRIVVYFVDGDQETVLDIDDLEFPEDIVSVQTLNNNPSYIRLDLEHVGEDDITYTDEDGNVYGLTINCELPRAGWYSAPEASEEYYLPALSGQMLYGKFGEIKTAYLVWDPKALPDFEGVTVFFKKSNEPEPALDDVPLKDTEKVLSDYNIKLTPNLKEGYIRVDAEIDIDKNLELTLIWDSGRKTSSWLNIDNEVNVKVTDWRSDKTNPIIYYRGEEYTFGIGRIEQSGKFDMFEAGMGFGATTPNMEQTLNETVYLGAMVDYDTKDEEAAPAWIYDCISDVKFEIMDWINADDLNDQAESNVFVDRTYTSMFNGCKMATADIDTVPGGFVEALLRVTFTVTMPGEEPVVCTVDNVPHFAYHKELFPDMSEIRTAEQLNRILNDGKTFTAWIREQDEANGTNLYEEYMTNAALNWDAVYVLELPVVTYDDIIEVNLSGVAFELCGSTDRTTGKATTMPGMWLHKNDVFHLRDINFVAVDGITQEYNGEVFTCGILAYGEYTWDRTGDAYKANECTFIGFDYGIRNTPYGYVCAGSSHFNDCEVGYQIDCAGKNGGNANDTTEYAIFENCKTAIRILGLPNYITSYDYRIYNCDFINNNKDIESEIDGRLYCYFNYFGHYTRGAKSLVDVTDLDQIQSRPAGIKEKKNATIITNPRYALPINAWDTEDSNYLTIDNGRHTYIFNKAGDFLLDAKALTEVVELSSQDVTINVMGDDEKVQGTWTFNGTEE